MVGTHHLSNSHRHNNRHHGKQKGTALAAKEAFHSTKRKEVNEVAKRVFAAKQNNNNSHKSDNNNVDVKEDMDYVADVRVPEFSHDELFKGKFLGKGHFGSVYEVCSIQPKPTTMTTTTTTNTSTSTKTTKTTSHHPITSSYKMPSMASSSSSSSRIWMMLTSNNNSNNNNKKKMNPNLGGGGNQQQVRGVVVVVDKTLKSIDDGIDNDDHDDYDVVVGGDGVFPAGGGGGDTISGVGNVVVDHDNDDGDGTVVFVDSDKMEQKKIFMAQHCIRRRQQSSSIKTFGNSNNSSNNNNKAIGGTLPDNSSNSSLWKKMYNNRGRGRGRGRGHARYAVKMLNREVLDQPTTLYYQAILDMATETQFLSSISHPNIIKLRAKAVGTPFDNEQYFIVMDRLYDVLDKRLKVWNKRKERYSSNSRYIFDRTGEKLRNLWEERIRVAYDISSALSYLHDRRIIHRDLKPDNLGFDIRDDIKIFDFGLAKKLPKANQGGGYNKDEAWKLTGETGTPRYMAPEVASSLPYNASCDVYSFCILLWEILSTKTPFELYSSKLFRERVWKAPHKRPYIDPGWPKDLQSLLRSGWGPNPNNRPSMTNIKETIQTELLSVRRGEVDLEAIFNMSRRSTNVFTEPPSSPKKNNNKKSVLSFAISPFQITTRTTDDNGLGTTQQTDASSSSPRYQFSPQNVLRGSKTTGNTEERILLTPRKLLALDQNEGGVPPVAGMPSPPMLLCDDMFSDDVDVDVDNNEIEDEDFDDICMSSVSVSGLDTTEARAGSAAAAAAAAAIAETAVSGSPTPPTPPTTTTTKTPLQCYKLYERLQQEQVRRDRIRNHISEVQQQAQ